VAKVRIKFEKSGEGSFISHLDLSRLFMRALNRANIKVAYTNGFNPHAYLIFGIPLSLGFESVCELLDFETIDNDDFSDIKDRINQTLPNGIFILDCYEQREKLKNIGYARYEIVIENDNTIMEEEVRKIHNLFSQTEVPILKKSKRGKIVMNLMDKQKGIKISHVSQNSIKLDAILEAAPDSVLNPEYVIKAIEEYSKVSCDDIMYVRKEIFDKKMSKFL
jgi:radical SAM-linked protein